MKNIFLCLILISLVACGTSGLTRSERKELKEKQELARIKEAQGLLDLGYYFFDAETVSGQGGGLIPINGEYYGLRVMRDSVSSFLPFFGTTQLMIDVYGDSGIKFHSMLTEKQVEINEKRNIYTLRGVATKGVVRYRVFLEVYENGNASLNVSPSNQSSVSYTGSIIPLKFKKE